MSLPLCWIFLPLSRHTVGLIILCSEQWNLVNLNASKLTLSLGCYLYVGTVYFTGCMLTAINLFKIYC